MKISLELTKMGRQWHRRWWHNTKLFEAIEGLLQRKYPVIFILDFRVLPWIRTILSNLSVRRLPSYRLLPMSKVVRQNGRPVDSQLRCKTGKGSKERFGLRVRGSVRALIVRPSLEREGKPAFWGNRNKPVISKTYPILSQKRYPKSTSLVYYHYCRTVRSLQKQADFRKDT